MVFGAGITELFRGRSVRTFSADATQLCPTAFIPMNQQGVRGFVLPDGTLMTGDVLFKGEDGVVITTSGTMSSGTMTISMEGVPPKSADDCGEDCGNIQTICFQRAADSLFTVSQFSATLIAIGTYALELDEVCAKQKEMRLPDVDGNLPLQPKTGEGPCDPPVAPPDPPVPPVETEICIDMADLNGVLTLVTPGTFGSRNVAYIESVPGAGKLSSPQLKMPVVKTPGDATDAIAAFTNPPRFADGVRLSLRGLAAYRRRDK